MDGRAVGDDLIGVHGHVRLLAGHVLDELLHGGHTGGAADEDDLGQIGELKLGVAQGIGDRLLAALEQVTGDLLELGAGQRVVEVQRAGLVHGDERQVDDGLLGSGELLLGVLGSLLQTLQGHGILAQVDAVLRLELVGHPVDDALIPVVAAEVVVAVGGEDLEHAVGQIEQGHVEGAAAEVEDEDLLLLVLLVQTIGERGGRGLVDDALNVEAGDAAGVLGGLTLGVIEVRGDGDDGLGDGLAKILLGVGLHLGEGHGADLLRRELLAVDHDDATTVAALLDLVRNGLELVLNLGELAAHEALDGKDGVLGVGHGLVLSGLAHDAVALGAEAHDGRRGAVALSVDDRGGGAALEHGHRGVGGTQVDTENLAHGESLSVGAWRTRAVARGAMRVCSRHSVSPYAATYTKSKSIHIRFPILHNSTAAYRVLLGTFYRFDFANIGSISQMRG